LIGVPEVTDDNGDILDWKTEIADMEMSKVVFKVGGR
jgi:hypothetical protein